jgi:GntR family transcriptional regulator/MocR family aminotransferase
LQQALARHLIEHRGVRTEPRQIIVTPSAQAAIELIARVTLEVGDRAWLENPGYGGAHAALEAVGARVPLDRGGLVLAGRRDRPKLIFVTPSHQYPTGRLMPVDRRMELLRFAASVGAVLIEDDYDSEFHYEGRPVAALQGLAPAGRVFYVGTFSKVMLADIRVGYAVVPESLVETFERAQRHTGQLVSATLQNALSEFMEEGAYAAHIRRMTRIYRGRRDRMVQALTAETLDTFVIDPPAGGMQLHGTAVVESLHRKGQPTRLVSGLCRLDRRGDRRRCGADRTHRGVRPQSVGIGPLLPQGASPGSRSAR